MPTRRRRKNTTDRAETQDDLVGLVPGTCDQAAPAADDAGVPAAAGSATDAAGGTFHVTRPAQMTQDVKRVEPAPRVLLAGIDTLDFGVYVTFDARWSRIVARLAQLQQGARKTGGCLVGGGRCVVRPGGKPNYPFQVQYPAFQLFLSRQSRPAGVTPNVYVSLQAQTLWQSGVVDAVQLALTALAELAPGEVQACRISRCDLATDVLLPARLTDEELRRQAVGPSRSYRYFLGMQ